MNTINFRPPLHLPSLQVSKARERHGKDFATDKNSAFQLPAQPILTVWLAQRMQQRAT